MTDKHTSKSYDQALELAKDLFLKMGELVSTQIAQSIHALIEHNEPLADQVIQMDQEVNQMERQLDEMILLLVARRQPAANDLRLIMAMSKGVVDLERIGDEATKIARIVKQLTYDEPLHYAYREIQSLANQVRLMIHDAMRSFSEFDAGLAFEVMRNDRFINQEYHTSTHYLINHLVKNGQQIAEMIHLLWALRALERIGDHAKNIAELVIYTGSGTDVRHISYDEVEKAVQEAHSYQKR